jgi:hypothetical protein
VKYETVVLLFFAFPSSLDDCAIHIQHITFWGMPRRSNMTFYRTEAPRLIYVMVRVRYRQDSHAGNIRHEQSRRETSKSLSLIRSGITASLGRRWYLEGSSGLYKTRSVIVTSIYKIVTQRSYFTVSHLHAIFRFQEPG